jgi:uncharacterized damage-inducible protein DinB
MKEHLARMLRAMAWADAQVLDSLRACPAAWGEALPLFAHVLGAEHLWMARLESRAPSQPGWPSLSLEECAALAAENAVRYSAYIDQQSELDLARVISYRTSQGEPFDSTVLDILTHVVIHGAYHRGQIAKVIGRAGGRSVNTDYIIFARSVEPRTGQVPAQRIHDDSTPFLNAGDPDSFSMLYPASKSVQDKVDPFISLVVGRFDLIRACRYHDSQPGHRLPDIGAGKFITGISRVEEQEAAAAHVNSVWGRQPKAFGNDLNDPEHIVFALGTHPAHDDPPVLGRQKGRLRRVFAQHQAMTGTDPERINGAWSATCPSVVAMLANCLPD